VYYDDSWVSVGTPGTIHAIATDGTVSTVFTTTTSVLTSLVYLGPGSFATVDLDNSVARLSEVLERIDVAAGTITPVPGLSASVTYQLGATADGTIYATTLGNTVVRVDPDDTVTTIAGTGTADPGTTAQSGVGTELDLSPVALATTPRNGLLIASGHVVYRLQDPAHAG
jgi:hypothetical protein